MGGPLSTLGSEFYLEFAYKILKTKIAQKTHFLGNYKNSKQSHIKKLKKFKEEQPKNFNCVTQWWTPGDTNFVFDFSQNLSGSNGAHWDLSTQQATANPAQCMNGPKRLSSKKTASNMS